MKKFKLKKNVVNLIGCSNKDAPKNLLKGSIYNSVWDSVIYSVRDLVRLSVIYSTKDSIMYSAKVSVIYSIRELTENDLRNKLKKKKK